MDIKYEKVITSKINKNILLIINLIIILLGISQNILLFLKNRPNLVIGLGDTLQFLQLLQRRF